nr:hypothetical protein [Tanacetum cinerariifolium]
GYNDVIGNQGIPNAAQNPRVQNDGNQNELIGVQGNGNQNQIGNGNLVAVRAEGIVAGHNGNQISSAIFWQWHLFSSDSGILLQAVGSSFWQ